MLARKKYVLRKGVSYIASLIILVLIVYVTGQFVSRFPIQFDEGIGTYGGLRILKGFVPYRDFFHITTPGVVWLISVFYKLLGTTFFVSRLPTTLCEIGLLVVLYIGGIKIFKNHFLILLPPSFFFIISPISSTYYSTHPISMFFSVTGAIFLLYSINNRNAFFAGFASGLSLLMNQNIGTFTIVGSLILIMSAKGFFKTKVGIKERLAFFSAGAAIVLLPLAIYLIVTGSAQDAFSTLIIWAFSSYRKFNIYPYFSAEILDLKNNLYRAFAGEHVLSASTTIGMYLLVGFLPFVLYPLMLVWSFLKRNWNLLCLSIMGQCLLFSSFNHPDISHVLPTLPLFSLVLFYSLYFMSGRIRRKAAGSIGTLLILIVFSSLVIFSAARGLSVIAKVMSGPRIFISFNEGIVLNPVYIESQVIDYIKTNSSPGEPIFIYHWSPILYFLCGRDNPTKFDTFQPGYNTLAQSEKIIEGLAKHRPPLIVKDAFLEAIKGPWRYMFPTVDEKTLSRDIVDESIQRAYSPKLRIGSYTIYALKSP